MIKAIIFDCFGVLVRDNLDAFYAEYLRGDPELIKKSLATLERASKGLISHEEFNNELAGLAHITAEKTDEILGDNPVNGELIGYIKQELKPKYKIGFLSNTSANWLDELFTPDQLELFEVKILSFQIGYAKPEAQAYEIAAERLGMRLTECVFIDDRQEYVDGAKRVGMKSILFTTNAQLKQDLDDILSS